MPARDPRLAPFRLPALGFAAYVVLQAASAAVLFMTKLGPSATRVAEFYVGSEARFTAPKSLAGLLEVAVPHLVAIPLVLFAIVHVVGWARALGARAFRVLTTVSFGSALLGIAAAFAIRWLAPGLAWAKIAAFVGLEAALLAWAALLVSIFRPSRAPSPSRAAEERRAPERAAEEVLS